MARKPKADKPRDETPDNPAGSGAANAAPNGDRDPVTGRWLHGNRGNPLGRPKGIDFRRLVMQKLGEAQVENVLLDVFKRLTELVQGKRGDVQAAKLILDRLCGKPDVEGDEDEAKRMTPEQRRAAVMRILGIVDG